MSFLLRVLNLGVSAWEMINNQHFTEVALVSLSYLLLILVPHVFFYRLLLLYACCNLSVNIKTTTVAWTLFRNLSFVDFLMNFRAVS